MATRKQPRPVEVARQTATLAARELLADYPHLSTPERLRADGVLEDLAYDRGARVELGALTGADGRLLRAAGRAVIRVRASDDSARRAFTIAHELGHLVLGHGAGGVVALCSENEATPAHSKLDEAAAHAFAAELLMPETMVSAVCAGSDVDLALADRLAATFGTSQVASARRMVELTTVPCAVIYAEAGRVTWARRSSTFRGFVPTGRAIPDSFVEQVRSVPAQRWDPRASRDDDLVEHTRVLDDKDAALFVILVSPAIARSGR